jgi:hypothetical protein
MEYNFPMRPPIVSLGLNSDNRTQGFGGHFYMYFSRRREKEKWEGRRMK